MYRLVGSEREGAINHARRGFTLLESLIALTILAIALTSLLQVYTGGMRVASSGNQYVRAQILAQSLLDLTTVDSEQIPRPAAGSTREFRWRVGVKPARVGLVATTSSSAWKLYHVTVTVRWDRDRQYHLQTLKLANTS